MGNGLIFYSCEKDNRYIYNYSKGSDTSRGKEYLCVDDMKDCS